LEAFQQRSNQQSSVQSNGRGESDALLDLPGTKTLSSLAAALLTVALLEHFQRIKNSFYIASAGRRNF
jgi:hypothetical protein